MLKRLIHIAIAGVLGLAAPAVLAADRPPVEQEMPPQEKLMAKRAAELDAYRLLAERILGLEIRAATSVRDFVTEDDRIATALDHFIKGVRLGQPRYFNDGTCEVDAEVTIEQVVTTLKKACDEYYRGGKWTKDSFEDVDRRTERKIIAVTGCGAVRPQTVIPDPAQEAIVPALAARRPMEIRLPEIYRRYPPAERLKAKRAAELDAYRKLMERIYGLQITSNSFVRDFVTEHDGIRACLDGHLVGARTMEVRYGPDGVVEVVMEVTIEQVITQVKRTCDEVYKGGKWTKDSFEDIRKYTERKVIGVVGTGALDTAGQGAAPGGGVEGRRIVVE